MTSAPPRGRATGLDTPNRFERLHLELDPVEPTQDGESPVAPTQFYLDHTRSILSQNNSPDVGFRFSLNPYRGCEHGCIYCYARPSHEYLGFSSGLDFETRILVKEEAPALLAQALARKSWDPQTVALSGNTDCYQPAERRLRITRRCLQVFLDFRNPIHITTKNHLVTRDLDILQEMAALHLVHVTLSVTTLKPQLASHMEPRTSRPKQRLKAIEQLAGTGIPVSVSVAPLIPGLTDEEIPSILSAAASLGARGAHYQIVRLPGPVEPLFLDWLQRHLPDRADRILSRLRSMRNGHLSDSQFGRRGCGQGEHADLVARLFEISRRRHRLTGEVQLTASLFRRPQEGQLELF